MGNQLENQKFVMTEEIIRKINLHDIVRICCLVDDERAEHLRFYEGCVVVLNTFDSNPTISISQWGKEAIVFDLYSPEIVLFENLKLKRFLISLLYGLLRLIPVLIFHFGCGGPPPV